MRLLPVALAALVGCSTGPCFAPVGGATQGKAASKAVCHLFVMTDCPIANQFAPEIGRIIGAYPQIEFRIVYEDGGDVDRHAREYGFPSALRDEDHALARLLGATTTPEAIVTVDGAVRYRGRIDDRYYDLGKWRFQPTTRDLRDALEDILGGRHVRVAETRAVGCSIPE